jgi:hypothetical protein
VVVLNLLDTSQGSVSLQHAEDALAEKLRALRRPVALVAHSLACVVVEHYVRTRGSVNPEDVAMIRGTFLMAPPVSPPAWPLRRNVTVARLNGWLPGLATWPVRWWLACRWNVDAPGAYDPERVSREAAAYVSLYRALRRRYEPGQIPGPVWISVHVHDTRSPTDDAIALYQREPLKRPPRWERRRIYKVAVDRTPCGPYEAAAVGRLLQAFALYVGS